MLICRGGNMSQVSTSQSDMSFWNTMLVFSEGLMNYSDYSRNSCPSSELWHSWKLETLSPGPSDSTACSQVDTDSLCVSNVFQKIPITNYFNGLRSTWETGWQWHSVLENYYTICSGSTPEYSPCFHILFDLGEVSQENERTESLHYFCVGMRKIGWNRRGDGKLSTFLACV